MNSSQLHSRLRLLQTGLIRRGFVRTKLITIIGLVGSLVGVGAAPPEILRVRVPAQRLGTIFPKGTELQVLPPARFEALVEKVRQETARQTPSALPRIVQARHQARWSDGILRGRTSLTIQASRSDRRMVPLFPWTPAITGNSQVASVLGLGSSGESGLWIDRDSSTITFEWELVARPESRGRGFTLGLPEDSVSTLNLDLPKGWIPFGPDGTKVGPLGIDDQPERSRWEFAGSSGLIDLRLHDPNDSETVTPGGRLWVGGETRIDLRGPEARGGSVGNWLTEWVVESDRQSPTSFSAELDDGLELISVTGPDIDQFQQKRTASGTNLVVRFTHGTTSSTKVSFSCQTKVPVEGTWKVPAIRPSGAIWTGGKTTIFLDDSRVVSDCRELGGRRLATPSAGSGGGPSLAFESRRPTSVAELVLRNPKSESTCVVVGQLDLGQSAPSLECRLKWTMPRGTLPELSFELPPTWIPDRVRIQGLDDALEWHSSIGSDGATRVTALVPTSIGDGHELTLILGASSSSPGGKGRIQIPRVRPVGTVVYDDCWVARINSNLKIEPSSARGIAWVDPFQLRLLDRKSGFPDLTSNESHRVALAWRWIEDGGSLDAIIGSVDSGSVATIHTRAKLSPNGSKLVLDGQIDFKSSESRKSLPIWLPLVNARESDWRFQLDELNASAKPRLRLTSLDRDTQAELGFPSEGTSWNILLPQGDRERSMIRFHGELAWTGHGTVPLLSLPKSQVNRSVISVEIAREFLAKLVTDRLLDLNPSAIELDSPDKPPLRAAAAAGETSPTDSTIRHTFSYSEPTAKLELFTEKMEASGIGSIVREATLSTMVDLSGRFLNRLRIQIQSDRQEPVEFGMPENSTLVRIVVDGIAVDPIRQGDLLAVPLSGSSTLTSSRTIVVDYLVTRNPPGGSLRLQPSLPRLKLPCLSFTWEILKPPGWIALEPGRGLASPSPTMSVRWPFNSLGFTGWTSPTRDDQDFPPSAELSRWLEAKLSTPEGQDLTLAECFTRWDSGRLPVIVDRVAILNAGLSPRSVLRSEGVDKGGNGHALRALRDLGVATVALDRALLITSSSLPASEIVPPRIRNDALMQAIAWGADRTDRFQSVNRWRGEMSPRGTRETEHESTLRLAPGWTISRFSNVDWPREAESIELVDQQKRIAWGFWTGSLVAGLFLAFGSSASRKESIGVALLLGICSFMLILDSARYEPFFAGGFLASLIILIARTCQSARGKPVAAPSVQSRQSSLVKRPAFPLLAILALGFGISSAAGEGSAGNRESSEPIVAIIPYEGEFDPATVSDRVILKLADYRRLLRLSRPAAAPALDPIRSTTVVHRVVRTGRQEAVVETDFELFLQGDQPATFDLSVSGTHRISALLDGAEAPVLIRPNGLRASVLVEGEGAHRLTVKRGVTLHREATSSRLLLTIDRFPSARVEVFPTPGSSIRPRIESHGTTRLLADQRMVGLLGPLDQLDIAWPEPPLAAMSRISPSVEGLLLWDIEPAGDRIRARYTYHGVDRLATVRFKIDPALIPRSIQCPGFVDIRRESGEAEPTWTVHIDPPLHNHATIGLEFWRPEASEQRSSQGEPRNPFDWGSSSSRRSLARIEPLDVERYTGAIGVRRPGNWTGRLAPLRGAEPISDETFVKLWGDLPSEPLTLSGITRFVRPTPIELRTGPAVERIRVRPTADFQLSAGRIDVRYEAEFADTLGSFNQTEFELPAKFHVTNVEAQGLTDWSLAGNRRLRLRFDLPAPPRRKLRINGWIPVDDPPLATGARKLRVPMPWIRWLDVDVEPGIINLGGATKPAVEGASGLKLVREESTPVSSTESSYRYSYRVDDASALGELVWEQIPPRVTVSIDSQMIVHRDWADWTAILRYDVVGGALDTLNFNLPTEWATEAKILLPGNPAQITKITTRDGITYSINPQRPIWGSQQLIIRGEKLLSAQSILRFPELTPLGRGVTDTYLNLVNATGESYTLVDLINLQEVGDTGRFQKAAFNRAFNDPNSLRTYHVRDQWALSLRFPWTTPRFSRDQEIAAMASFAEINLTETPSRSIVGEAIYDLSPGGGWFLPIVMPREYELLYATADRTPVPPYRTSSGDWMIPVAKGGTRTVRILWRRPGTGSSNSEEILRLPRTAEQPASTIVRSNAGDRGISEDESSFNQLQATTPDRFALSRATAVANRINQFLAILDRGSFRDREELVVLLIEHELALREASRSVTRRADAPNLESGPSRISQVNATVDSERNALEDSVKAAGLAEISQIAKTYLGRGDTGTPRPAIDLLEANRPPRIRDIGTPSFYEGVNPGGKPRENEEFLLKLSSGTSFFQPAFVIEAGLLCIPFGLSMLSIPQRLRDAARWTRFVYLASLLAWVGWAGGIHALIFVSIVAFGVAGLRPRVEPASISSAIPSVP